MGNFLFCSCLEIEHWSGVEIHKSRKKMFTFDGDGCSGNSGWKIDNYWKIQVEYTRLVRLQGWSWVGAFSMSSLTMYFPFLVIMIMIVTMYFLILYSRSWNQFSCHWNLEHCNICNIKLTAEPIKAWRNFIRNKHLGIPILTGFLEYPATTRRQRTTFKLCLLCQITQFIHVW